MLQSRRARAAEAARADIAARIIGEQAAFPVKIIFSGLNSMNALPAPRLPITGQLNSSLRLLLKGVAVCRWLHEGK